MGLRRRFLEVLYSPNASFPCAASAVYSESRRAPRPWQTVEQRQDQIGEKDCLANSLFAKRPDGTEFVTLGRGDSGATSTVQFPGADEGHRVDWRPDVKRSSHRNLGKLVRSLVKDGVITSKEV